MCTEPLKGKNNLASPVLKDCYLGVSLPMYRARPVKRKTMFKQSFLFPSSDLVLHCTNHVRVFFPFAVCASHVRIHSARSLEAFHLINGLEIDLELDIRSRSFLFGTLFVCRYCHAESSSDTYRFVRRIWISWQTDRLN